MPVLYGNVGAFGTAIAAAVLVAQGYAPSLAVNGNEDLPVPQGSAAFSGYVPIAYVPGEGAFGPGVLFGLNLQGTQEGVRSPPPGLGTFAGYAPLPSHPNVIWVIGSDDLIPEPSTTSGTAVRVIPGSVTIPPGAGSASFTGYAPVPIPKTLIPVGIGSFAGYAPSLASDFAYPGIGSSAFTGYIPVLADAFPLSSASVTATGYAPSLAEMLPLSAGSAAFAGYVPSLESTSPTIAVSNATLVATGYAFSFDVKIPVQSGSAVFSGFNPAITVPIDIPHRTAIFAGDYFTLRDTIAGAAGSATFTGYAPISVPTGIDRIGSGAAVSRRATVSGSVVNVKVAAPAIVPQPATTAGSAVNVYYTVSAVLQSPVATMGRAAMTGTGTLSSGLAAVWGGALLRPYLPVDQVNIILSCVEVAIELSAPDSNIRIRLRDANVH